MTTLYTTRDETHWDRFDVRSSESSITYLITGSNAAQVMHNAMVATELLSAGDDITFVWEQQGIAISLREYIRREYGGCQAAFARDQDVNPPQVTQWINKDFIVVDHELFSHRRTLKHREKR